MRDGQNTTPLSPGRLPGYKPSGQNRCEQNQRVVSGSNPAAPTIQALDIAQGSSDLSSPVLTCGSDPVPGVSLPCVLAAFNRWLERHRAELPADLASLADRAILALSVIHMNRRNAAALRASKEMAGPEIDAFESAYRNWKIAK